MYYYVVNPAAGGGAINGLQDKLRTRLKELGIEGEMAKTTGPGDATKMVKRAIAEGATTIVAVGGDGTVNEVINGVSKDSIAVGIIPIGRGNQVATRLGIPGWREATDILAARRLTSYGLIAAGQHYFLSSLNLGFETAVDNELIEAEDSGGLRGRFRKLTTGWNRAGEFEPLQASLEVDGKYTLTAPVFNLRVTNQKFDDPQADNRLRITISSRPDTVQRARYAWSLLRKEDTATVSTTRFLADRVVISTKPVTPLLIDGKHSQETPVAIRLTNRRIRFITGKPNGGFKEPGEAKPK